MKELNEKHRLTQIALLESELERNQAETLKLKNQATEISEKTGLKGMIVTNILSIFIVTLFFSQGILPAFESINESLVRESKDKIHKAKSTSINLVSNMRDSKKELNNNLEDIRNNLNNLKNSLKGQTKNKVAPEIRKIVLSVEKLEKQMIKETQSIEQNLEDLKSINIDV